jgi:hypothetical protein
MFCCIDANDLWEPVYIRETGDLSDIFDNHRRMDWIMGVGATHIHAHTNKDGVQIRLDEKEDLVQIYNPICQSVSA